MPSLGGSPTGSLTITKAIVESAARTVFAHVIVELALRGCPFTATSCATFFDQCSRGRTVVWNACALRCAEICLLTEVSDASWYASTQLDSELERTNAVR